MIIKKREFNELLLTFLSNYSKLFANNEESISSGQKRVNMSQANNYARLFDNGSEDTLKWWNKRSKLAPKQYIVDLNDQIINWTKQISNLFSDFGIQFNYSENNNYLILSPNISCIPWENIPWKHKNSYETIRFCRIPNISIGIHLSLNLKKATREGSFLVNVNAFNV